LRTNITLGLIITCFLLSCQKKNEKAVILLSPFDLYIPAEPKEVVVINITCNSPFEMKQFVVKSRMDGGFSHTELDTAISGKDFFLQYEYQVPDVTESSEIILEFNLVDASNERIINFRVIEVLSSAVYLTETAGHEMYSGNSGKHDGYNLLTGTPQYRHLADSSQLHIADTTKNETLLKRWISPAGAKFVKFNGLDYANCTSTSAKAAYNAGLKSEFVNDIQVGDIYISKIRNIDLKETYPVIKVVDIIDLPGSDSDRYIFNIKK
jgi:hypothetical protein